MVEPENSGWALPYTLEWLSVPADQLVMAPWVRQFQEAGRLVRRLRDTARVVPDCTCSAMDWPILGTPTEVPTPHRCHSGLRSLAPLRPFLSTPEFGNTLSKYAKIHLSLLSFLGFYLK